jgi:hypothetical protein
VGKLDAIKAWGLVLKVGLIKWPLKLVAPIAYFFIGNKNTHPVFGVADATDKSWYNIAIRNGVHNYANRERLPFVNFGNYKAKLDWSLEKEEGFQWRYRRSYNGQYVSFRCTWGKPRNKGKREFYIGWTMDSSRETMRCTFFQLRIF